MRELLLTMLSGDWGFGADKGPGADALRRGLDRINDKISDRLRGRRERLASCATRRR
jgi:hypothetical protein